MSSKIVKILRYTLSFALAGVLVYFAFRGIDWGAFLEGLKLTRWAFIGLFFVAATAAVVFRMLRWKAMLLPVNPSVSARKAWDAANVGNFINVVLPGAGEFVRCGMVSGKGGAGYDKVLGTIVMERIWDVFAVLLLFVASLALKWGMFGDFFVREIIVPVSGRLNMNIWLLAAITVSLLAAFLWTVWHFRTRNRFFAKVVSGLQGLLQGFGSFLKVERKWLFLLYTILIWLMYLLMSLFVLKAIPGLEGLDFTDALFLSAVGNIASVIPVPGGIGAYHYLIALGLSSLYGASWETGILFATLSHEAHALLIIVLGVISYASYSTQVTRA